MRKAALFVATACLFAATAVRGNAEAENEVVFRPYFGGAYERGTLAFKSTTLYAEDINGYALTGGLAIAKHFDFEFSLRKGSGTGASVPGTLTQTTSSATIATAYTTSYHGSSFGVGLDLIVKFPLGDTGVAPFVLAGLSIDKLKEVTRTDSTIVTTPIGSTTSTTKNTTVFATLLRRTEVSPELGIGIAYRYSSGELRVLGRIQNLNMENTGKYCATLSVGLLLHL